MINLIQNFYYSAIFISNHGQNLWSFPKKEMLIDGVVFPNPYHLTKNLTTLYNSMMYDLEMILRNAKRIIYYPL